MKGRTSKMGSEVPVKIMIAGYGKVGQDMVGYMGTVPELVNLVGIVEPSGENEVKALRTNLPVCGDVETGIRELCPGLVLDCTSVGQGAKNLETYLRYEVPAILQSGERHSVAPLYIPAARGENVVRIPKCSASITNSVLMGLLESWIMPNYVEGAYYKTMPYVAEGKGWWEPEYTSAREIEETWEALTGEQLRIGRISSRYLPGEPQSRSIYSADILMTIPDVSEDQVLAALKDSSGAVVVASNELNSMPRLRMQLEPFCLMGKHNIPIMYEGMPLVPVIDEGSVSKLPGTDILKLHVEAVSPLIDLFLNLMAALEMTGRV